MRKWIRILLHGKAAARQDVRDAVKELLNSAHLAEVRVTWEAGEQSALAETHQDQGR